MSKITEIDKNFKNESKLDLTNVCFYNVKENPWCVCGLICDDFFRRMPKDVADKVNEGVQALHTNTSGGRIRFKTNSRCVAIRAVMPEDVSFPHMPATGISGFDMYVKNDYVRTFVPPLDLKESYEGIHYFDDSAERDITINFPLYNNVREVCIGLEEGSTFDEHTPYENSRKIVYYGSSITQGGCASRPGLAYPAQVSLKLDCDYINLGFSGSAKGEILAAEYIAGLDMDIFVMDYDHNAPTPVFLEQTHEKFFEAFRSLKKSVPVVFLSAPNARFEGAEWRERRDIVYRTYEKAINSGDDNVYFVDGNELWGDVDWRECSVDGTHPNDIGHYKMAQYLIPVFKEILNSKTDVV